MKPEIQTTGDNLAVTRVRHPLKLRLAQVLKVVALTPKMIRVTVGSDDLRGFASASFDDHVKVFFPAPGETKPVLPTLGPDGPVRNPNSTRALMRDFTPRRFDPVAGRLDLEFVLHEAGPATTWAAQAQVGQYLGIGGPRGSMIIPTGFDWHLLVGDETALPAIARRLEELPRGVRGIVIAAVSGPSARLDLVSDADLEIIWCDGSAASPATLMAALLAVPAFPAGQGYAWVAAESSVVREIRTHLVTRRGMEKSRIRAAAYWKRGEEAAHEVIDD